VSYHGKTFTVDPRSLYLFRANTAIRRTSLWITEWKWFDRFILLAILVNSITLAITDYQGRLDPNYISPREKEMQFIEYVLTVIFIMEFLLKVLARGFVVHPKSYLRNYWNVLDFIVVVISILGLFNFGSKGLKALRTFRMMRPLKTINALPRMRMQIQVLIMSIPGLANVMVFLTFIFTVFSILGAQVLSGG